MSDRLAIKVNIDMSQINKDLAKLKSQVSNTKINLNTTGVTGVSNSLKNASNNAKEASKSFGILGQSASSAFAKFGIWFGISTAFVSLIRNVKDSISWIKELDDSVTTMKLTFDATEKTFDNMVDSTTRFAKALGSTVGQAVEATKIYANLNTTLESILEKSKASIVLSNLGGSAVSIQQASDAVQALQQQFDKTDSELMGIVDNLTYVSSALPMEFSRGINEITRGLQVSGSMAKESGFEIETYTALIGKLISTTRLSGSTVGSGVRQIMSRIGRVTNLDAEEISQLEGAYKAIGIQIRKNETDFENMSTIMDNLSKKWNNLTDVQKRHIAFLSAGSRRQDLFLNLMKVYSESVDLATESLEKNGFAMERNEIFLDSLTGRLNVLKTTWQEAVQNTINGDDLKIAISSFTSLIGTIGKVTSTLGGLGTAFATIFGALSVMNKEFLSFSKFHTTWSQLNIQTQVMATNMTSAQRAALSASNAFKAMGASINFSRIASIGLNMAIGAGIGILLSQGIKLINDYVHAEENRRKAIIDSAQAIKESRNEINQIEELIAKKKELEESEKSGAGVKSELVEIERQLAQLMPETVTRYDEENKAISENTRLIEENLNKKREAMEIEANKIIALAGGDYDAENKKLDDLIKKRDSLVGLIKTVTATQGTYAEEENTEGALKLMGKELNKLLPKIEEQQKVVDKIQWALGVLNKKTEGNTKEINDNTDAQEDNNKSKEDGISTLTNIAKLQSDLAKSYKDTYNEISYLNKTIKEYDENNKFSSSTLQEIIEKYPDLIKYMGDQGELADKLKDKVKEEKDAVLNGIEEKIKALEVSIGEQAEAYGIDLENFTNLEKAKVKVANKTAETIANIYKKYFGDESMMALPNIDKLNITDPKLKSEMQETIFAARANVYMEDIEKAKAESDKLINELDEYVTLKGFESGIDFTPEIDTKKASDNLVELDNKYLGVKNTIASLTKEIDDYNMKLKDSNTTDVDKIAILEKLNNLYPLQQQALRQLNSEYEQEQTKIKDLIDDYVKFDETTGRIVEMPSKVTKEQSELIKSYQDLGDQIEDNEDKMKSLDLEQNKNINTISDLKDEINKSFEEMSDNVINFNKKVQEMNLSTMELSIKRMTQSLEPFNTEVDLLKTKLDFISNSDTDEKMDVLGDIFKANKKKTRELIEEFNNLEKLTPRNSKEAELFANTLSSLSKEISDGVKTMVSYEKELDELEYKNLSKGLKENIDELEKEFNRYQNNLEKLQGGLREGQTLEDNFGLPAIDFGDNDYLDDYERIVRQTEDREETIQAIKEESLELQRAELKKSFEEETEEFVKHNEDMLVKIAEYFGKESEEYAGFKFDILDMTNNMLSELDKGYDKTFKSIAANISNYISDIKSSINSLNSTVGTTVKKVGSSISSNTLPGYEYGTKAHPGGLALLGDGKGSNRGEELVILPSGKSFLAGDKGEVLLDLPKGTTVVPHKDTKEMIKDGKNGISKYANGTNDFNSLKDYILAGIKPTLETINEYARDKFKNYKRKGEDDTKGEARRDFEEYWKEVFGYVQGEFTNKKFKEGRLNKDTTTSNTNKKLDFKKDGYSSEIKDLDELIDEERERLELLKQQGASQIEIDELTQSILDKVDEQISLAQDEQYSKMFENLKHQIRETSDALDELEDEFFAAEGNPELQQKIKDDYDELYNHKISLESKIRDSIKNRYESEFSFMDKQLNKNKKLQDDIKDQLSLLDDTDYSKRLKFTEDLLDGEKKYNESLQDNISILKDQMNNLEVGSYEWNILNDQVGEYKELLEDSNININDMAEKLAEIDFDKMMSGLSDLNNEMNDLQYELDIQTTIDSSDIDSVNAILQKMNENTEKEIEYLYTTLDQLKEKQSLLDVNSAEWDVIGNQIDEVNSKIRQGNLELMERSKNIFSGFMGDIVNNIETSNPRPNNPSSVTENENDYISGLEKELEIKKLENFIAKNSLTLSESQLAILNSTGKIKRDSLEMLQKELELQQLQLKLDNLREQETIQQLQKQDDGTWDFTYVADQDAIDETQNAILDKQIEIEKARKESQKQAQEDAYQSSVDSYDQKMNELQEILDKAESRSYKSIEEFRDALERLGLDLPIDEMVQQYAKYFEETGNILIQDAVDSVTEILETKSEEFENAGNNMGKAYVDGLLNSIDSTMEGEGTLSEKQEQILDMLANEYAEFALVGNQSGMALIQGLIDGMATDDYAMDFDEVALKIKEQLTSRAAELESGGQDVASAFVSGLVIGIDEILNNGEIENKTQAILDLLNKSNEYGTLGSALGSEFMNSMISVFENTAGEIEGEGDGAISQAINTIVGQLDAKIIEFAEKGDLQGVAYAEALRNKLIEALTNAELTQQDIINLLNTYSDFDLAGLLSGEAYTDSLGLELDNAQSETQNSTSAIVQGLEEDVANFGNAGAAQGEAYATSVTSAFNSAVAAAKQIVSSLTNYVNSQNMKVKVTTVHEDIYTNSDNSDIDTRNMGSAGSGGLLDFNNQGIDGKGGKLIIAHPNEIISNPVDSEKLLEASRILKGIDLSKLNIIDVTKNLIPKISIPDFNLLKNSQTKPINQHIHVEKLELPNVTNTSGAELLVKGLNNLAKQSSLGTA